jgi:hypothetical protein
MDGFVNAAGTTVINLQRQHTVGTILELEADVAMGLRGAPESRRRRGGLE